jgi:cytoskeleton protein RodZ
MSEADIGAAGAPAEAGAAAPGRRLAQARALHDLSPSDVARQLKLSVWQIEALEAGQFDRLPGPVFVRGFIRNYAHLLKLDPEDLLQSAGDSLPQQAPRPETPPSQDIPFPTAQNRRWPGYAIAAAVLVAGLAFYEFYMNEPESAVTRPVAVAPAPVAVVPPTREAAVPPAPAETGTPATGAAPAGRPTLTAVASAISTARDAARPAAGSVLRESDRPAQPGERRVQLIFDDESWVEIRDGNGVTIFSQLNRAGTRRLVTGLPPLTLVVGNAHGVRLTYDDRPVDLARHTKVDVARLTLE